MKFWGNHDVFAIQEKNIKVLLKEVVEYREVGKKKESLKILDALKKYTMKKLKKGTKSKGKCAVNPKILEQIQIIYFYLLLFKIRENLENKTVCLNYTEEVQNLFREFFINYICNPNLQITYFKASYIVLIIMVEYLKFFAMELLDSEWFDPFCSEERKRGIKMPKWIKVHKVDGCFDVFTNEKGEEVFVPKNRVEELYLVNQLLKCLKSEVQEKELIKFKNLPEIVIKLYEHQMESLVPLQQHSEFLISQDTDLFFGEPQSFDGLEYYEMMENKTQKKYPYVSYIYKSINRTENIVDYLSYYDQGYRIHGYKELLGYSLSLALSKNFFESARVQRRHIMKNTFLNSDDVLISVGHLVRYYTDFRNKPKKALEYLDYIENINTYRVLITILYSKAYICQYHKKEISNQELRLKCLPILQACYQLAPKDPELNYMISYFHSLLGEKQKALFHSKISFKKNHSLIKNAVLYINLLYWNSKIEEAFKCLNFSLSLDKTNIIFNFFLCEMYSKLVFEDESIFDLNTGKIIFSNTKKQLRPVIEKIKKMFNFWKFVNIDHKFVLSKNEDVEKKKDKKSENMDYQGSSFLSFFQKNKDKNVSNIPIYTDHTTAGNNYSFSENRSVLKLFFEIACEKKIPNMPKSDQNFSDAEKLLENYMPSPKVRLFHEINRTKNGFCNAFSLSEFTQIISRLTILLIQCKKYKEALDIAEKLNFSSLESPIYLWLKAFVFYQMDKLANVDHLLKKNFEIFPNHVDSLKLRSLLCYKNSILSKERSTTVSYLNLSLYFICCCISIDEYDSELWNICSLFLYKKFMLLKTVPLTEEAQEIYKDSINCSKKSLLLKNNSPLIRFNQIPY